MALGKDGSVHPLGLVRASADNDTTRGRNPLKEKEKKKKKGIFKTLTSFQSEEQFANSL
jgi:hypothetical protein